MEAKDARLRAVSQLCSFSANFYKATRYHFAISHVRMNPKTFMGHPLGFNRTPNKPSHIRRLSLSSCARWNKIWSHGGDFWRMSVHKTKGLAFLRLDFCALAAQAGWIMNHHESMWWCKSQFNSGEVFYKSRYNEYLQLDNIQKYPGSQASFTTRHCVRLLRHLYSRHLRTGAEHLSWSWYEVELEANWKQMRWTMVEILKWIIWKDLERSGKLILLRKLLSHVVARVRTVRVHHPEISSWQLHQAPGFLPFLVSFTQRNS